MDTEFGRWPWSWPIDVPATIEGRDDGLITLTRRGVIYDSSANVGNGYEGEVRYSNGIELGIKVPRGYLRRKLRDGEWRIGAS